MVSEFFKSLFKMKLLFIANRIPYPPHRGDKLKIYNLALRLKELGHELHLVTFTENKVELKYETELKKIFQAVHLIPLSISKRYANVVFGFLSNKPFQVIYFQNKKFKQKVDYILAKHKFDAVHIQHLRMLPYGLQIILPKILDLPDAYSMYWFRKVKQEKNKIMKLFKQLEYKRVLKFEKKLEKFDKVLVCSAEDQKYLETHHQLENVELLSNGVDLRTFRKGQAAATHERQTILFTGNMNYTPNIDAVRYFVSQIWPQIRKKHPNARFVIAGQNPTKLVRELASEEIEVTGFVEDIASQYQKATVIVSPLRIGAGTQNKVLEALAMEKPVVCTPIGFEGLKIRNGHGVLLAKSASEFSENVNKLLEDKQFAKRMAKLGYQHVRENFDWDIVAKILENYFLESIKNHESTS